MASQLAPADDSWRWLPESLWFFRQNNDGVSAWALSYRRQTTADAVRWLAESVVFFVKTTRFLFQYFSTVAPIMTVIHLTAMAQFWLTLSFPAVAVVATFISMPMKYGQRMNEQCPNIEPVCLQWPYMNLVIHWVCLIPRLKDPWCILGIRWKYQPIPGCRWTTE